MDCDCDATGSFAQEQKQWSWSRPSGRDVGNMSIGWLCKGAATHHQLRCKRLRWLRSQHRASRPGIKGITNYVHVSAF